MVDIKMVLRNGEVSVISHSLIYVVERRWLQEVGN